MTKKAKKRDLGTWLTHHTIHIALFAVFVGFIAGMYVSFFFLESDWKPGILYADEHADDHDHDTHDHSVHDMYEIGAIENPPSVELLVEPDAKSGYNLYLETTNFEFTPQQVNLEKVMGEGHAHLYINGEKISRLYSPYYHLDGVKPGSYELMVTLNTNDHFDYAIDGQLVSGMYTFVVE